MDNKYLYVTTDDGRELKFRILFTYHSDNFEKDYVAFYDEKDEENVLVCSYDEEHNLYEIEDEEEFKELDEVLQAYDEEQNKKQ